MSAPRWYFTEEQLANSPSRKCGINSELELSYRQRAANLIQEMGQRLQVYVQNILINANARLINTFQQSNGIQSVKSASKIEKNESLIRDHIIFNFSCLIQNKNDFVYDHSE